MKVNKKTVMLILTSSYGIVSNFFEKCFSGVLMSPCSSVPSKEVDKNHCCGFNVFMYGAPLTSCQPSFPSHANNNYKTQNPLY